jgi:hypothetical protein
MLPFVPIVILRRRDLLWAPPPPLDLRGALQETTPHTPLLFVLTPSAAPLPQVEALAGKLGETLSVVGLGQGQEEGAEAALARGAALGW